MVMLIALLVGLLLLILFNYFGSQRDLLSPAVVMPGMFIISSLFALLNAKNWHIDYAFLPMFYILTGIAVFSFPVLLFANTIKPNKEIITQRILTISVGKILFAIFLDIIIIYLYRREMYQMAARAGYSGQSIQWFIRNSTSYEGSIEFSSQMKLLVRFVDVTAYIFLYTFINNFLYKSLKKIDMLLLLPVILFIYKTALTGGRQDVLKILFAAVVQLYILQKTKYGWNKNISIKYLMYGLFGLLLGIPGFYYGLFLVGRTTTRSMLESVSTYIGGPIQHFNQFVQEPTAPSRYFGAETMTPILNMLGDAGLIDFKETIHLEFRRLGVTIGNVYTFFRRPLHDFGPLGMYVFVFLVGFLFGFLYYVVIRSKKRNDCWDMNVITYSYLFYWIFLSSIEQYSMTIISVFTLIGIILIYILSIFYWRFKFTPRGIVFICRGSDIIREEIR